MSHIHITINLDEPVFAERVDKSLAELIVNAGLPWAGNATCATQESDGEVIFWDAPLEEVREARCNASLIDGLMPLIWIGKQTDAHYVEFGGRDVVAHDWESAVVSKEMYFSLTRER